ncbi:MAG: hypothetical protein MUF53_01745 [Gemmatimonadaceae bacterium]|nr:hypothetical protein [Gemmatimonadaceae bacterium]
MGGPGPKLDGAGMAKMAVLEEAQATMALVHSQVEKMGVAIKNKQPTTIFVQSIKRQLTPLTTKLKMQFGMIADQVTAFLLASTRGGSDQVRLRSMREHVAQLKVALEIAIAQTIAKHVAKEGTPPRGVETQKPGVPRASQAAKPTPPAVRPSVSAAVSAPASNLDPPAVAPAPSAASPASAPSRETVARETAARETAAREAAAREAASRETAARDTRGTSAVELDANGNPVPRRTTSSTPPTI